MGIWERVAIGSVASVFDGPHATPKTIDDGPIFLGIGSLQNGRINLGETRHVSPDDFAKWTRRVKPRYGDVVFSYETRIGQAAMIPEGLECCLGRRMGLVRPKDGRLNSRFFLYYYLSPEFQEFLRSRTISGATVDRIALKDFPQFSIPLPPYCEQSEISSILGSLDDKIELNRRMNETLEASARELFRDWFVDFGPTRAKAEGRPAYLAPDLWSLFPDRLGDDGVPEGWQIRPAGEMFRIAIGRTPPRKEQHHFVSGDEGVPWLSIKTMGSGDTFIFATEEALTGEAVRDYRVPYASAGTVLVSFKLTVGRVAIAGVDVTTNEAIAHFNEKRETPFGSVYTYMWLKCFDFETLGSTSSIATAVNSQSIRSIPFLVPDPTTLTAMTERLAPIFARIRSNIIESRTLAETRDALLPKLMSGAIRVRDAERVVAA